MVVNRHFPIMEVFLIVFFLKYFNKQNKQKTKKTKKQNEKNTTQRTMISNGICSFPLN